MPDPRPEYRLTFRALPGELPVPIRLRHLLKDALRSYGLRCTAIEEVKPSNPDPLPKEVDLED